MIKIPNYEQIHNIIRMVCKYSERHLYYPDFRKIFGDHTNPEHLHKKYESTRFSLPEFILMVDSEAEQLFAEYISKEINSLLPIDSVKKHIKDWCFFTYNLKPVEMFDLVFGRHAQLVKYRLPTHDPFSAKSICHLFHNANQLERERMISYALYLFKEPIQIYNEA
ncbi:hypothetical protein V6R21_17765 [Limibacter armeniacum]|uniref:hypothetical protein n=1 Tax=Limibacter armeniacum TaxID=466084 RepID=UPI002FE5FD7C